MIMKKDWIIIIAVFILLFGALDRGYAAIKEDNNVAIAVDKYKRMPLKQLLDKGDKFSEDNMVDSALIAYSMIYSSRSAQVDTLSKQIACRALSKAAILCYCQCDYKLAMELLLKALEICEEIDYKGYIGRIYNNIGNVYRQFKDYGLAKKYYKLAYNNGYEKGSAFNNLGLVAFGEDKLDSALLLYKESYNIKKSIGDFNCNATLNNIGTAYQKLKQYDSAFFYYHAAVNNARKFKKIEKEAIALSNIGPLHFELKKYDSAIHYLHLSSNIARRAKLFDILASNYLSLSQIEEAKGNVGSAFGLYKKYSRIKDSLFNASEYGRINGLRSMYDMGKIDKQIKELNLEQEIKERTIKMQQRLQIIMGLALLTVVIFLFVLYLKNKTLNKAYSVLVSKNIEIVESDKINQKLKFEYEEQLKEKDRIIKKIKRELSENYNSVVDNDDIPKYRNSSLSDDSKNKLISDILEVMNNRELICNPDFSLNHLAEMVDSNQTYVSRTINDTFKRNFRTFINDYRIKEARRMLSDPSYHKYSIKSIATMVGFKSRNTFDTTFKEVTGVTPSFYVRSLNRENF